MKHGLNTDKDNNKRVSDSDPCFIRVSSVAEKEFVSSMAKRFTYLRWRDDGTPAAGTFEGWPKTLREFTMLEPCCGSGHFLVAGFHLLVPLRMHDEGLSAKEAVDAVLRENLFGLEIDPRCTQIAAFALAMAAWKFPDENGEPLGYRPLPPLNVACSGQGVVGTKEQWTKFADGDSRFKEGMERLYDLFHKAPTLGSLIDRRTVADDLFTLGFDALKMIILEAKSLGCRLSEYAKALAGINSGDAPRFVRKFWELGAVREGWEFQQTTTDITSAAAGYENIFLWEKGAGTHAKFIQSLGGRLGGSWRRGQEAWGKQGVAVSQMSNLPVSLYNGNLFDNSTAVILPHDPAYLPAIWAFCRSPEFLTSVRAINQKINVDNGYLSKIQFDFAKWSEISDVSGPIPPIVSNNATQWLFRGHPKGSTDALQVAVARLLGFRWPDQEPDDLDTLADKDGIVPIPSMRGEPPAADRLREVLRTAFGSEWSGSFEHKLLTEAGAKSGTSLDDWLLNSFFEQHCRRFHHRPFVCHVRDGRKDGFACLVNYHKLDQALLETLTYSYLQDWINTQAAEAKASKTGADLRLSAAQELHEKLKLILEGAVVVRNPEEMDLSKRQVDFGYDIFVRWKPLAEQSLGWNPDLNNGVRPNIRPFVEAGILRKNPNIKWTKDRGNEPQRPKEEYPWFWPGGTFKGDRVNDRHYTNAEKEAARKEQGAARK